MQYGIITETIRRSSSQSLSWPEEKPKIEKGEKITLSATLSEKALEIFLDQYACSPSPICLSEMGFGKVEVIETNFPNKSDLKLSIQVNKNPIRDIRIEAYISDSTHSVKQCQCAHKCSVIGEMIHFTIRNQNRPLKNLIPGIHEFKASHVAMSIATIQKWEFRFNFSLAALSSFSLGILFKTAAAQNSPIPALKGLVIAFLCSAIYKTIDFSSLALVPFQIKYGFKEIPKASFHDEICKIQKYGKLRGIQPHLNSRNSLVNSPRHSEKFPEDVLVEIASVLFNEWVQKPDNPRLEDLKSFERVSKSWWKACSKLLIHHEMKSLSKDFSTKMEQFPLNLHTTLKKFADQSVGILHLNPHELPPSKPSDDAISSVLPSFCGVQSTYDPSMPNKYPSTSSKVKYFTHPEGAFATTLIDFIAWPIIENFSLLYIEDPFRRPTLAMPYKYSNQKGKGVLILQKFEMNKQNKEWWLLIDRPMEGTAAKVTCFLYYYDKTMSFEKADSSDLNKQYLNWLNKFLSGRPCKDSPSSTTERHIQHYLKG